MDGEKGLVDLKQSVESSLPIRCQIFIVAKQQEAVSLQGLLAQLIQFSLLFSAQVFDGPFMSAMMW